MKNDSAILNEGNYSMSNRIVMGNFKNPLKIDVKLVENNMPDLVKTCNQLFESF